MKTKLTYPDGNLTRLETDATIIARLESKGWTNEGVVLEPAPNTADLEQNRLDMIDRATGAHILGSVAEHKQRNMIARALELIKKLAVGDTLTAGEQAELNYIESVWAWVKAIRAEGDRLKADPNLSTNDATYPAPL